MRKQSRTSVSPGSGNTGTSACRRGVLFCVVTTVAGLAFAADRADAASYYGYWDYEFWRARQYAPQNTPHSAPHKHRKEPAQAPARTSTPKGPVQIVVSIADQKISVYSGDALIARSVVSTGVPGHRTPMGVFSVIQKQRWHRSNLYSSAPMPYMQRITWSGVALHAGVVPGHPASHGCIRLKEDFAVELWRMTKLGARVIIAPTDVTPVEVSQPRLFATSAMAQASSSPSGEPAKSSEGPDGPGADLIKPVKALGTAAADLAPAVAGTQASDATAQTQVTAPVAKPEPISVFISRKQHKLFVRQGFTPLLNAEVTIRDPERPLGTHVFTSVERREDSGALRWTVVSFPNQAAPKLESAPVSAKSSGRRDRDARNAKPAVLPRTSPERANAALDRIEIPQEIADRLAALLMPKSSLTISDEPLSEETDSDTDFIVLVH